MVLPRPNIPTEETSDTRDVTTNSTYGVLRPTSASDVYRVGRHYVGMLRETSPPAVVFDEWNDKICGDLINHLLAVTDSLPNNTPDDDLIIEPILCMAGKSKTMKLRSREKHASGMVLLEPMVWIHCGSRKCKRKVKETLHQARFLQNFLRRFDMPDAYIALEAPWPAAHIASTSDLQYLSVSVEQKVSSPGYDHRPYNADYYTENPCLGHHPGPRAYYPLSPLSLIHNDLGIYTGTSRKSSDGGRSGYRLPSDRRPPQQQARTYSDSHIVDPTALPVLFQPLRLSRRETELNSSHYELPLTDIQPSQRPNAVNHEPSSSAGTRTRPAHGSCSADPLMSFTTDRYAEHASSGGDLGPRQRICEVNGRQLTVSFAVSFPVQQQYIPQTACGMVAKFTVHDSSQSLSTIGGLILVDDSVFGLTTAHGIISCLAAPKMSSDTDTEEDTSESDSDSESPTPVESSSSRNEPHAYGNASSKPARNIQITGRDVWSPILLPNVISYKGRGTVSGDYALPMQSPSVSDFALVDLDDKLVGALTNTYRDPSTSIIEEISGSLCNNQLSAGEVLVITSSNTIQGFLLDGIGSIILRGTTMRTRKIQISSPQGWRPTQDNVVILS
jgi:hypothetical protein